MLYYNRQTPCFNPRTREGCDPFCGDLPPRSACFNPRTREGCDRRYPLRSKGLSNGFNPRTREGCDARTDDF